MYHIIITITSSITSCCISLALDTQLDCICCVLKSAYVTMYMYFTYTICITFGCYNYFPVCVHYCTLLLRVSMCVHVQYLLFFSALIK